MGVLEGLVPGLSEGVGVCVADANAHGATTRSVSDNESVKKTRPVASTATALGAPSMARVPTALSKSPAVPLPANVDAILVTVDTPRRRLFALQGEGGE